MSEIGYQADVSAVHGGVKELESLASKAGGLLEKYVDDYMGTAGWQGPANCGDSLSDMLTYALEGEFADVKSALESFRLVLDGLSRASEMGDAVEKPVGDAVGMIADAKVRH
ncbi:hypothetical protein [Streptomyces sp. NBC_00328]|uniref:hypothetical protein n=1 Tax=Streptomyces sp. NBC_00328 TaxID=2903646 RepID=UPI002E2E4245|nr:hypothetical protein [Streptomyces sp. NBC_00328]